MTNKLKNKRGFSLVELMVVVAIMGTLASIAIPAFNEYRKSAKKAAYRTDLSSLHKSWLAFGVEVDSFCERDTQPQEASIASVGMQTLLSSKLYGDRSLALPDRCSGGSNPSANNRNDCIGATPNAGTWLPAVPAGTGPGKHNFIGFGNTAGCTSATFVHANAQILGADDTGSSTTQDVRCVLGVAEYEMGVYGHISGADYFGISINNNGVLSGEEIKDTNIDTAVSGC